MANQERKVVWVFTNFLETGTGIQDGHTHTHTQSSAFRVVGFEVTNIIQRLSEYNPCYKKKKKKRGLELCFTFHSALFVSEHLLPFFHVLSNCLKIWRVLSWDRNIFPHLHPKPWEEREWLQMNHHDFTPELTSLLVLTIGSNPVWMLITLSVISAYLRSLGLSGKVLAWLRFMW